MDQKLKTHFFGFGCIRRYTFEYDSCTVRELFGNGKVCSEVLESPFFFSLSSQYEQYQYHTDFLSTEVSFPFEMAAS